MGLRLSYGFLMNIPKEGASLFTRIMGLASGPKVRGGMKLLFWKDKRAPVVRLASLPGLARLVPSHRAILTENAAATLGAIAMSL